MQMNSRFERVNFNIGKKINASRKIDISFSDTMHWHPFVEILLSRCDNNEITINFTKHILKINDLIILYPGDLHSLDHVTEDAYLLVQFPLDLLSTMSELNNIFSLLSQYHCIKYDAYNINTDRMTLIIKEIIEIYFTKTLFGEVRIYSLLLDFFVKLGQYCLEDKKEGFSDDVNAEYKSTRLMAEACLYISQNCTEPLTLDDISQYMGISKSHFAHLFKKYTNMTFIDFLTTERIKRTETLISNSNLHITDIAFDSGFSSISSFNRAFKKIKGISPREFRETFNSSF